MPICTWRSTITLLALLVALLAAAPVGRASGQPAAPRDEAQADGDATFYYRDGKKVPLTTNPSKSYVLFDAEATRQDIEQTLVDDAAVVRRFEELKPLTTLRLRDPEAMAAAPKVYWAIIDDIQPGAAPLAQDDIDDRVLYQAPFLLTEQGAEVGLSHLFLVKLHSEADLAQLEQLANRHRVEILGNNRFQPLWYTLGCSKRSDGNALEMANRFWESGHFAAAEPDFLVSFQIRCANDTLFSQQWGMRNTGQDGGTSGIDIRACDAWNLSRGHEGIVVAVVDHGIELDHPDMPNMASASFDAVNGTSPSQVRGNHGTACAGIVGAARNNNAGVAGVAPSITLMSVSHSLTLAPNAAQQLANGISWAVDNGADVISNSWGHAALASAVLDDAIEDAMTTGRGGRGAIVVFAAGNADGAVIYPANSDPRIVAVGAMSPCGERKNPTSCDDETWWGSCFGNELDVVAPGVLVPTTDRQGVAGYSGDDYTPNFNGTSSACPHVAGVAALILAVNPALTRQQVVDVIERTARKVGGYAYQTTSGRGNGTWHDEMGYGLIDARACLDEVSPGSPSPGSGGPPLPWLDVLLFD